MSSTIVIVLYLEQQIAYFQGQITIIHICMFQQLVPGHVVDHD